jgi:hypothetical protein
MKIVPLASAIVSIATVLSTTSPTLFLRFSQLTDARMLLGACRLLWLTRRWQRRLP